MTAAALATSLPACGGSAEFPHVLAGAVLDGAAARLAAALDRGLLAEAGWDPAARILFLPAQHRLLGRQVCAGRKDATGPSTTTAPACATGVSPG